MGIELSSSKIDVTGKGVTGLPDTPALSTEEMQKKFDEIPRLCVEQINKMVDDLNGLNNNVVAVPNLLHNADWAYSLVNQRGHSGAVTDAYCIDRWIGNGTVIPMSGEHVALSSGTTMTQYMEIIPVVLADKECTFSIDVDGESVCDVIAFPAVGSAANVITLSSCTVELGFLAGSFVLYGLTCSYVPYIKITAKVAINVKRVFLEFGRASHMNETPPNEYVKNILICQRQFINIDNIVPSPIGVGFMGNSSSANVEIFTPVRMRALPTWSLSNGTIDDLRITSKNNRYSSGSLIYTLPIASLAMSAVTATGIMAVASIATAAGDIGNMGTAAYLRTITSGVKLYLSSEIIP